MRPIASLGLILLLAGCSTLTLDDSQNLYRTAVAPEPYISGPPATPMTRVVTPPAVGYGSSMPRVPSGGLGAEAPMPAPKASKIPSIGPGVPPASTPASSAGQPIVVPNGNGTSTIIHADGTVETVPTPK
jgi:hypothetical protein